MFKRRKPDDLAGNPPAEPATDLPSSVVPGAFPPAARPDPATEPPDATDSGLGVPPFRPALAPSSQPAPPAQPASSAQKESSMGRSPFPTAGSATNLPPAVGPRPAPAPTRPNGPGFSASGPGGAPFGGPPPRETGLGTGPREMIGAQSRDAERRTLVVGRGISLQGNVQDAERLVVEGTIEATMINAAELVVANGGMFKGEVQVDDAEVAGTFDGTLTVRNTLVVRASGKLLGTARCRRLQVEDGGQITGRIEMLTADTAAIPAANTPTNPATTGPTAAIAEAASRDVSSAA